MNKFKNEIIKINNDILEIELFLKFPFSYKIAMSIWRKHHYTDYDVNVADTLLNITEYTMPRKSYVDICNYFVIILVYLYWKLKREISKYNSLNEC